jgi:Ca-activated chloride channel family protein
MSNLAAWLHPRTLIVPLFGAALAFPSNNSAPTSDAHIANNEANAKQSQTAVVIRGRVTDASSGAPIAAARILLGNTQPSATTSVDGNYTLRLPLATRGATIVLRVNRVGYEAGVANVKLTGDTVRADIALTARWLRVESVVISTAAATTESRRLGTSVAVPSPATFVGGKAAGMRLAVGRAAPSQGALSSGARAIRDSIHPGQPDWNREQYDRIEENPFLAVSGNPRSTFSIDVDRASYGNVRRYLSAGQRPPADAVRIEELINYFPYSLNEPRGADPIAITTEVTSAPWQPKHRLVRIALQARRIDAEKLPPNNLVFLIDVSGSMESPDKLPLVKESLRLLVNQLREQDRVALVVYAGNAGLVLPSTSGADKARIADAIDRLEAGGSTAGGAGLELAYRMARETFMRRGNNRVILATDGDFNVGASSDAEMERLIEAKRSEGTYLTVLGFGRGNIQDAKMEKLAKKGNGNFAYIDNIDEARKTLVREMGATLLPVANDVKLQVEFNPAVVRAHRLIGYEDRLLRDEDFTDDRKDAGDIGAGHTVTALYEVVPVGVTGTVTVRTSDSLRYVVPARETGADGLRISSNELLYVKLRYKTPGDSTSRLMTQAVSARGVTNRPSDDFRWAASVASFGMLLRNSKYKGNATSADVLRAARGATGSDVGGYRAEFIKLVERWQDVSRAMAQRDEKRDYKRDEPPLR